MWCGSRPVTAVLVAVVAASTFASSAHAPRAEVETRAGTRHPATCKPLPPLVVDAAPVSGSGNRWSLTLRSIARDRDVEVWMQTTPDDRRIVWRGRLTEAVERHVEVRYDVPAHAERVFVALEPVAVSATGRSASRAAPEAALAARGFAVCEIPGRTRAAVPQGRLLEDAATGVKVRQFIGTRGGSQ